MKKKYTPYGFNEKIENKIYSQIGKGQRFRINRKKIIEEKQLHFDNYLAWERYIADKFPEGAKNRCNLKHYLNKKLRICKRILDICKSLAVPMYAAEITGLVAIHASDKASAAILGLTLFCLIIFVLISVSFLIFSVGNRVDFFEDCINIIESMDANS